MKNFTVHKANSIKKVWSKAKVARVFNSTSPNKFRNDGVIEPISLDRHSSYSMAKVQAEHAERPKKIIPLKNLRLAPYISSKDPNGPEPGYIKQWQSQSL